MSWQIPVFGVRHLSPMGAWQLRAWLDRLRPEVVLIEGLDDATPLLDDITHRDTRPPIAILAYTDALPVRTLLYPLADYSPEYQAMAWARKNRVRVEFIDLPSAIFLGLQDAEFNRLSRAESADEATAPEGEAEAEKDQAEAEPGPRLSVYERCARLAGESDYETYWERHFEHNAAPDSYYGTLREFGRNLRALEADDPRAADDPRWLAENLVREAYMRRRIAATLASGVAPDKVVAIVGAFHADALHGDLPAMSDAELARLPRRSSQLTLMPYSYFRLSSQSGYGAGNAAPAYFELLWQSLNAGGLAELPMVYLSQVARHMREHGMPRSTAEVIDCVRLAQTLAAMRNGLAPTLADLRDAAVTLLGQGEVLPVRDALAAADIGAAIGSLPKGVSRTSLQADFEREMARLKLDKYKTPAVQELALDLRENRQAKTAAAAFLDLGRSTFFHRLRILNIGFAQPLPSQQHNATWAEAWKLAWTPECEITLVEAVLLGETVELACADRFASRLADCHDLPTAAALVHDACLCGLMPAMDSARQRLQAIAATSSDFPPIAQAAWQLSRVVRYGDVRQFDARPLLPLIDQLFTEAALALFPGATCDDAAMPAYLEAIDVCNRVGLENHELVDEALWIAQLQRLADADDRNATLSGYACALLLERGLIANDDLGREVVRRLSPGVPADLGAGWFEGLSQRNRYALLGRQVLWQQLADYVAALDDEHFPRALVFLRRAFATFSPREKRQIAENLAEYWGVNADATAELLEAPLSADEQAKLDTLNDFDFDDL